MNLVEELNKLLADLAVLYRKLQNYHWNIEGQDFFMVHAKLEEYYTMVNAQIDEIGEHILIIGGEPLGTMKDYLAITCLQEAENQKVKSGKIYETIIKDFLVLVEKVKNIKKKADEQMDYATSALMDNYISGYGKMIWMLQQTRA